ncbi:DEAD/DEAH box helicase [Jeotgalibacillus aurantiacus]|uniref:DEAD/DEAH box helicase n=1 Tax=Jeotgalibacillus aurantiacus TaxID=2763266 RepID=UPI001D09EFA7|nr:DEAD/DEAH box helicase [Jeotgalibacillus aurantiacus]
MNALPTEEEIRQTAELLVHTYGVKMNSLMKLMGRERYKELVRVFRDLREPAADEVRIAQMLIVEKGPYLFAGSSEEVRDLRIHLLRQLSEERLMALYERNKVQGKAITSPTYMRTALAKKKWLIGGRWARDFVTAFDFPLVFSGISIPKDHSTDAIQDIEPRRAVPKLVEYQVGLKSRMLEVLNKEQDKTRCVVTLPTGGGKTRVAVESFIDWMQPRFEQGKYMLWIAQGEELCEQAISCISEMWQEREFPEALRIYRFFGGKKFEVEDMIGGAVIASIQQLYSRIQSGDEALEEILANCGAMIIDEAHHATAKSYRALFDRARELAGDDLFPICGLTATPGRSNDETMKLVDQFDAYLIHPSFPDMKEYNDHPLRYFRKEGYLAEPVFILHEDGVETEVTDDLFNQDDHDLSSEFLQILAADQTRNLQIINYMKSIPEGSSSLVYACTVQHAEFLAMTMNAIGRKSAVISADTPKPIRRMHISAFKKGDIEFLFNYGVLTTGFDAPRTDHLIICRPTSSIILYEQMVGRGLRGHRFGGTETCKIIDFSTNIRRHGEPLAYARFLKEWDVKVVGGRELVR